jgi:hypothetical protein
MASFSLPSSDALCRVRSASRKCRSDESWGQGGVDVVPSSRARLALQTISSFLLLLHLLHYRGPSHRAISHSDHKGSHRGRRRPPRPPGRASRRPSQFRVPHARPDHLRSQGCFREEVQLLLSAVALSPPLKDRHPHHPVLPMGSFAVPCVSFLSSLSRRALSPCADANCLLFLTCRLYRCVASTSLDAQSSFVTDAAAI